MLDSKLTVKLFLNKRLKNNGEKYPLYVRVTYKRKNNQIPYRNLVFEPDMDIEKHPYVFNKDFLYTEKDFLEQEDTLLLSIIEKIEKIINFLAKYGKDDLAIFPNIVNKLNKNLNKVIKHIIAHKLDQSITNVFVGMKDDEASSKYIMDSIMSFTVAQLYLVEQSFLLYDYILDTEKRLTIENLIYERKPKHIDDLEKKAFETVLYREFTNYLFS